MIKKLFPPFLAAFREARSAFGRATFAMSGAVFAVGGAMLLTSCGVHQVVPASGVKSERRGAAYYLPRTVVVANVPVKMAAFEKGEFHDYCLPLLRILPNEVPSTFSLGEEFTVELSGERDPEQRFIAVYPTGPFRTFNQIMTFNEQGVLTKGDSFVENKTVEFIVSTLEAGAKVASSAIKAAGGDDLRDAPGLDDLRRHINSLDDGINLSDGGLRVGLRVLLADNPEVKLKELETSEEENAKNWKAFFAKCPRGRFEMISATRAYKELKVANEALENATTPAERTALRGERDNLLLRFVGKKSEKTWVGQFRWVPPKRQFGKVEGSMKATKTLLSVGETSGVSFGVSPESLPSVPFRGKRSSNEKFTTVALTFDSQIPEQTASWEKLGIERARHGWHYRIPAQTRLSLTVNGRPRVQRRTFIAQHGCIAFVPATSYGQKVTSIVELDPVTGALKSATHGGQAFDPGMMNKLGNAAAGVIDAESERAKAEATANDPVTQLTRKKTLLQLQKDIDELEKGSAK